MGIIINSSNELELDEQSKQYARSFAISAVISNHIAEFQIQYKRNCNKLLALYKSQLKQKES